MHRGELQRAVGAVVDERPVHEEVVHHTHHRAGGRAQGDADRPAALDDVGLLHEPLGHRVRHVVDRGHLRAGVDPALGRDVRLERAEVVDVVLGDVEAHRGQRAGGQQERQLRRADLDGEHVEPLRVHHRVDERDPDVADGGGPQTGRAQHRLEHERDGGLAVRAGHHEPGRGVGSAQPPRQLELAPHRDTALLRSQDHGRVRRQPGRHHEHVDVVRERVAVAEPDGARRRPRAPRRARAAARRRRRRRRSPAAPRCTSWSAAGEAGDADARHDRVHRAPVRRPAVRGDVGAAHWRTHSA